MGEKQEVEKRIVIMVGEREDTERVREIEDAVGVRGRTLTLKNTMDTFRYTDRDRKAIWGMLLFSICAWLVVGKGLYVKGWVFGVFESLCYMIPWFLFCGWDILAGAYMYSHDLRYARVGGVSVLLACVMAVVFVVWLCYGVFEKTDAIFYLFSLLGVVTLGYKEETLKFLQKGILPAYQWKYKGLETLEEITSRAINLKYEKVGVYVEAEFWRSTRILVLDVYPKLCVMYCDDYVQDNLEDGEYENEEEYENTKHRARVEQITGILTEVNLDAEKLGMSDAVFTYFMYRVVEILESMQYSEYARRVCTLFLRHWFENTEIQRKYRVCFPEETPQNSDFSKGIQLAYVLHLLLQEVELGGGDLSAELRISDWVSACESEELICISRELREWGLLYYRTFENREYVEMLFEVYRNITKEDALYIRLNALWFERTTPITQMEEGIVTEVLWKGLQSEYACILQLYADMRERRFNDISERY